MSIVNTLQLTPQKIYLKIKSLMLYHNIVVKYFFYPDVEDETIWFVINIDPRGKYIVFYPDEDDINDN